MENQQLQTTQPKTPLLVALTNGKNIDISLHLSEFKELGVVNYRKIMQVPNKERIPELVKTKEGRAEVLIALTAAIKSALGNINVRVGLNADQLVELADRVIDSSHEDNLSVEDVLIFLQQLLVGDCGKVNDRMDITIFFERFEVYRQKRYTEILAYREEQNSQYKILGKDDRKRPIGKDHNIDGSTFLDLMQTMYEGRNEDSGAESVD